MASSSSAHSTALSSPSEKSKSTDSSTKSQRKMSQSAYYNRNPWSSSNSRTIPPVQRQKLHSSTCAQAKQAREERLKKIREQQQAEMERRQAILRETEEREERMRAAKEAELHEKSRKMKEKEVARAQAVADRRKRLEDESTEKRQALLAKYRAQSENRQNSGKTNKPTYAFGSSTPRVLAYLQNLDADQQVYDKKLKSTPLTAEELAALPSPSSTMNAGHTNHSRLKSIDGNSSSAGSTPTRGRTSSRRPVTATDRMTQSMHVPSPKQSRPASSHPKLSTRTERPKENAMTKSFTAGSSGPPARPAPRARAGPPSTTRTRPIAQRRSVSKAVDSQDGAKQVTPKRTSRDPSAPSRLTQSTLASGRKTQPADKAPESAAQPTPPPPIRRRTSSKQPPTPTAAAAASATASGGGATNAQATTPAPVAKSPRELEKTVAGPSPPGTPPDEKRARSSQENGSGNSSEMDVEHGRDEERNAADSVEESTTEVTMQSPAHSASTEYSSSASEEAVVLVTITEPQSPEPGDVNSTAVAHVEGREERSSTIDSVDYIANEPEPNASTESGSDTGHEDGGGGFRVETTPTPKGTGQTTEQTEDAAKAALAEKRRLAREALEKEAERKREQEEAERIEEEERAAREEEEFRRQEAEELRLLDEMKKHEELRMQAAIEEKQKRDEEERVKREEEERQRAEEERIEREKQERDQREKEEKLRKEQEEREERKRRLEAIKARMGKSPSTSSNLSAQAQSPPSTQLTASSPVREIAPAFVQNNGDTEGNQPVVNGNKNLTSTNSSSVLQKLASQSPVIGQILSRHKSNPSLNQQNNNADSNAAQDINDNNEQNNAQDRLAQSMIQFSSSSASNEFLDPFQSSSHSQQAFIQDNVPEHISIGLTRTGEGVLDDFDPFSSRPAQRESTTPVHDPFHNNNTSTNMLNGSNDNADLLNF